MIHGCAEGRVTNLLRTGFESAAVRRHCCWPATGTRRVRTPTTEDQRFFSSWLQPGSSAETLHALPRNNRAIRRRGRGMPSILGLPRVIHRIYSDRTAAGTSLPSAIARWTASRYALLRVASPDGDTARRLGTFRCGAQRSTSSAPSPFRCTASATITVSSTYAPTGVHPYSDFLKEDLIFK